MKKSTLLYGLFLASYLLLNGCDEKDKEEPIKPEPYVCTSPGCSEEAWQVRRDVETKTRERCAAFQCNDTDLHAFVTRSSFSGGAIYSWGQRGDDKATLLTSEEALQYPHVIMNAINATDRVCPWFTSDDLEAGRNKGYMRLDEIHPLLVEEEKQVGE